MLLLLALTGWVVKGYAWAMSVPTRRERQKTELRAAILDAATEMIVREGFAAFSMRKLAESIEYSVAALYQYFENRDEIAGEVVKRGFARLRQQLEPARLAVDPRQRLEALGRAYIAFGFENPQTYRLIFMEKPDFSKIAFVAQATSDEPAKCDGAYDLLMQTVSEYIAAGYALPGTEPQVMADSVHAAVHGIVSLRLTCIDFPTTPIDELTHSLMGALMRGYAAKSAG